MSTHPLARSMSWARATSCVAAVPGTTKVEVSIPVGANLNSVTDR